MKLVLFFLVSMVFSKSIGQEDANQKIAKGTIHTSSGNTVDFADLEYRNDKVYFSNLANSKRDSLLQSDLTFVKVEVLRKPKSQENEPPKISTIVAEPRRPNDPDLLPALNKFPDGVYMTMYDFLNQAPKKMSLQPFTGTGFNKQEMYNPEDSCYFYDKANDSKIKGAFAVVWRGYLYFSLKAILKYRNSDDINQDTEYPNMFVHVLFAGSNYYYMEASLANAWSKAGFFAVGGSVGYTLASGTNHNKGVLWDCNLLEFNILRHCDDLNVFLEHEAPTLKLDCKQAGDYPNVMILRDVIRNVLKP